MLQSTQETWWPAVNWKSSLSSCNINGYLHSGNCGRKFQLSMSHIAGEGPGVWHGTASCGLLILLQENLLVC